MSFLHIRQNAVTNTIMQGEKSCPSYASLDAILESIPISLYHWKLLLLCGSAFMVDSLEVNLLSYISSCAGFEWGLNSSQQASIVAAVFGGELIGSLFWGRFADEFGRRISFLSSCTLISVSSLLSSFVQSLPMLIFLITLTGFGIGGISIPFDLLAEIVPSSHRGNFLVKIQYFWTIGAIFVNSAAWLLISRYGWRVLIVATSIPVILTSLLSTMYLPESPRWLVMKGRTNEAEKFFKQLAASSRLELPPFTLHSDQIETAESSSYLEVFCSKKISKISWPLYGIWAVFGFSYYGIILFVSRSYSNTETTSSNNTGSMMCEFDCSPLILNSCAELVGVFISSLCVDSAAFGRVHTQTVYYSIGAVAVLLMGIAAAASTNASKHIAEHGTSSASFELQSAVWGYVILIMSLIGRAAVMAASVSSFLLVCVFICIVLLSVIYNNPHCYLIDLNMIVLL